MTRDRFRDWTGRTVDHEGDRWTVLGVGRETDDGREVYLHLSSTTRGFATARGRSPVQVAAWFPTHLLTAETGLAGRESMEEDLLAANGYAARSIGPVRQKIATLSNEALAAELRYLRGSEVPPGCVRMASTGEGVGFAKALEPGAWVVLLHGPFGPGWSGYLQLRDAPPTEYTYAERWGGCFATEVLAAVVADFRADHDYYMTGRGPDGWDQ